MPRDDARALCQAMTGRLAHRGPDAEGVWQEPDNTGPTLGHRRLSIFDLSDAGRQPMSHADGRHVISFNGEIYNFRELRGELGQSALRSQTDTEVLLALLARDGAERTLPRLEGMFAFAWWDRDARCLTLARDAFGKKPLLVSVDSSQVVFASELTAFLVPGLLAERRLDEAAVRLMLSFGVIPEPYAMLAGVSKLGPGQMMRVSLSPAGQITSTVRRWIDTRLRPARPAEGVAGFGPAFERAVRLRLAADVPVGALLSGGIDSSLVAAQAQKLLGRPLKTFTIGFDQHGFDESIHAEAVARHLGTEHHVLSLTASDLEHSLEDASGWSDEPFADTSAIPLRLLSAYAREHVTVALTGDGGDETGLGYTSHLRNAWIVSVLSRFPAAVRRTAAAALALPMPMQSATWLRSALRQPDAAHFYLSQRMSRFRPPEDLLAPVLARLPQLEGRSSDPEWLGDCDLQVYLVDDMLAKVDRFAMSVGLELRSPLLDQGVVGLMRGAPASAKISGGRGKQVLRRALADHFPSAMFDRPKSGFRAPIGLWLNSPRLREQTRAHVEAFDDRFGWRDKFGCDGRQLWSLNSTRPDAVGNALWSISCLMSWLSRHEL